VSVNGAEGTVVSVVSDGGVVLFTFNVSMDDMHNGRTAHNN